jgi:hypothetical protein
MVLSLKHSFQSAKADGTDSTLVQPSNWNDEHVLSMADDRLIGRTTAGPGAAEEISVGSNLSLAAGVLDLASSISLTGATLSGNLSAAGVLTSSVSTTALTLNSIPLTVTGTELNFVSGVTSSVQTQLNGKQPLAIKLTNLAAMSTAAGAVFQTGDDSFAKRSLTGTANQITITNGNGVSGNPTFSLPSEIAVPGAVTATASDDGTKSSGTYTPTPVGGNFKRIVNGGAFTLAAPTAAGDYTLIIQITNNGSAGAVTFSGFSKTPGGDNLTTANGDDFFLFITKCNGFVSGTVQALQ